jgi:hypothetical protein
MAGRKKNMDGVQLPVEEPVKKLIAKKDWRILSGKYLADKQRHEFDITIKVGDDVSGLAPRFIEALKTEQVI